jgi:hypothetical protein
MPTNSSLVATAMFCVAPAAVGDQAVFSVKNELTAGEEATVAV